MNYCNHCAHPVVVKIPEGETLPRHICEQCGTIHYQNPKIVAGCIPEWNEHILLCRRAIEPRVGYWTFPAGFMELGEATEHAAARETLEEAEAEVDIINLYAVFTLTRVSQVYVVFRGSMRTETHGPGQESTDTKLVHPDDIPWDSLAFPVIKEILTRYVHDRRRGTFGVYYGVIERRYD